MSSESNWDTQLLKLFAGVENDADSAMAAANSLLGSAELKRLPETVRSGLRHDLEDCRKARDDFLKAMDAGDPKKMDKVFNRFALCLTALQVQNEYVTNLADSQIAGLGADMLAILVAVGQDAKRYIDDSEGRVQLLRDKLKKAVKAVTYAKLQTALNVALSAAILALPELEAVAAARVALASMGGHFTIDILLGPKGVDAVGGAVTVAGDIGDAVKRLRDALSATQKKLLGAAGMIATLGLNAKELKEAKDLVEEATEALEKAQVSVENLAERMKSAFTKLPSMERNLASAIKAAQQASSRSKAAAEDYSQIRKAIAAAK